MKKIGILGLGCLLIFLLASSFKRTENHPKVTITPAKLQLFVNQHTDPYTIKLEYTVNVPANYLPSCARLVFQPYFTAPGENYSLTSLIISGKEYLRREKRLNQLTSQQNEDSNVMNLVSKGEGMKIRLSAVVPFQLWMVQAKLQAQVSIEACHRKKEQYVLTLAEGMFYMPLGPGPARVEYKKEKATVQQLFQVNFYYPEGQYNFNRDYDHNAPHVEALKQLLDSLQHYPSMQLQKIILTGSSSPSGSLQINERLAEKRAQQFKQYLLRQTSVADNQIKIKTTGENWEGFRELVQQSSFSPKEAIWKILEGPYSDVEKEKQLQQLPEYRTLRENLFPQLRKVTCQIYYTREKEVTRIIPL